MDLLPKPSAGRLPLLVTGGSQQAPEWIARNGDGWITYPRQLAAQAGFIKDWRARAEALCGPARPVVQPLYLDLRRDPRERPQPIHPGFRLGANHLRAYLKTLEQIGVNHVALNLRFNRGDTEETMRRLADDILPGFPSPACHN